MHTNLANATILLFLGTKLRKVGQTVQKKAGERVLEMISRNMIKSLTVDRMTLVIILVGMEQVSHRGILVQ